MALSRSQCVGRLFTSSLRITAVRSLTQAQTVTTFIRMACVCSGRVSAASKQFLFVNLNLRTSKHRPLKRGCKRLQVGTFKKENNESQETIPQSQRALPRADEGGVGNCSRQVATGSRNATRTILPRAACQRASQSQTH